MSLAAGTGLGPYEIGASIGAGDMGEVYRARDSKLDREVAIEILPAAFAQDAERLARLEREAKLLASLNHPNIATIHGLEEDAGRLGVFVLTALLASVLTAMAFLALSPRTPDGPRLVTRAVLPLEHELSFGLTPSLAISPDGQFVAYVSDETGQPEIDVRAFEGAGQVWRASSDGGTLPRWNPDGRELLYLNGSRIMVVDIDPASDRFFSRPRVLLETGALSSFDVSPDGRHFVVTTAREAARGPTQLNLVLNWGEELKRLLPP